jgi:hypothetical protein
VLLGRTCTLPIPLTSILTLLSVSRLFSGILLNHLGSKLGLLCLSISLRAVEYLLVVLLT